MSNRFTALGNFDDNTDINRAWETTRHIINISAKESLGYYEMNKHTPWIDEECSKLPNQRKQAKCNGYRIQQNK
jgi:hypothetical protein